MLRPQRGLNIWYHCQCPSPSSTLDTNSATKCFTVIHVSPKVCSILSTVCLRVSNWQALDELKTWRPYFRLPELTRLTLANIPFDLTQSAYSSSNRYLSCLRYVTNQYWIFSTVELMPKYWLVLAGQIQIGSRDFFDCL